MGLWRVATLLFVSALACNERPADVREWRVTDHDRADNPNSGQQAPGQGQVDPEAEGPAPPGLEDVTIVAWQQNCTPCHGQLGRGDGPRGPMVKATNLSEPAWQAAANDEQIARTIKEGKGLMPAFKLPDSTIANLVKLVRMMNAAKAPPGADGVAPNPTNAPSASASPLGSAAPKPVSSVKPKPVSGAAPVPSAL